MTSDSEPTSGAIIERVHRLPVRVYYEDTDFTGVVYYANYLKFLERGRTDFLRCAGVGHAELAAGGDPLGFAVREANVKFHKPARIDDALTVETALDAAKGARIRMSQHIRRGADLLIEAAVEAACIGFDGRPRRLPATVGERISASLGGVLKST